MIYLGWKSIKESEQTLAPGLNKRPTWFQMREETPLGKCPKCDCVITEATIERIKLTEGGELTLRVWEGISYVCPNCRTVMSIAVNPWGLQTDTAQETVRRMKRSDVVGLSGR